MPIPLFAASLQVFLSPIWLLSLGVLVGVIVLLLLWGLLAVVSKSAAKAVPRIISEGVLQWVSYVVLGFVFIAVIATYWMPHQEVFSSLKRIGAVADQNLSFEIPSGAVDHEIEIAFRTDELTLFEFTADQELLIDQESGRALKRPLVTVKGKGKPYKWEKKSSPFLAPFEGTITKLFVTNPTEKVAKLTVVTNSEVRTPQIFSIPITAASVVGVYLLYFLFAWLAPRISVIALATTKETIAQPIYWLLLIVGAFALLVFIVIPYNTFGEDVRMLKDVSVTLIKVLAIITALWTSSVSVSDEIEGKTALTLLSKPVGRPQFVLGKFFGISWAILLMFIILGVVLLFSVSYKVIYDSRESAASAPDWHACYAAVVSTIPGLVLALMEAIVMASVSVALSTRLAMVPNLAICGTIYVLGHLIPNLVQSSVGQIEFVAFASRLIATVIPVLDVFDVQAAVTSDKTVPLAYLGWNALYAGLYCTVAMLFALFLFHDRDLA